MNEDRMLSASLVLMLVSMPLISAGSWNDIAVLWWIGLALLVAGAAMPPVMRFAIDDDTNGDDTNGDDESTGDHDTDHHHDDEEQR